MRFATGERPRGVQPRRRYSSAPVQGWSAPPKEATLARRLARGRSGSDASRRHLLALVGLGVAVALAGGAANGVSATAAKKPSAVPGELIVGFNEGVSQGQQNAAIAQAGAKKQKGFR
ncbi:hypothetical protein BH09ACT13_BH09ACT13_05910 [soil metagenome]